MRLILKKKIRLQEFFFFYTKKETVKKEKETDEREKETDKKE